MGYDLTAKVASTGQPELSDDGRVLLEKLVAAELIPEEYVDFLEYLLATPAAIFGFAGQPIKYGSNEGLVVWRDLNGVNRDRWVNGQTLLAQAGTAVDSAITATKEMSGWPRSMSPRLQLREEYGIPAATPLQQGAAALGNYFTGLLQVEEGIETWLLDPANAVTPELLAALLTDTAALAAWVVDEDRDGAIVTRDLTVEEVGNRQYHNGVFAGDAGSDATLSNQLLGRRSAIDAAKRRVFLLRSRYVAGWEGLDPVSRADLNTRLTYEENLVTQAEEALRPLVEERSATQLNGAELLTYRETAFSPANLILEINNGLNVINDHVSVTDTMLVDLLVATAADEGDYENPYKGVLFGVGEGLSGESEPVWLREREVDGERVVQFSTRKDGSYEDIPDGYTVDPDWMAVSLWKADGTEIWARQFIATVPVADGELSYAEWTGRTTPARTAEVTFYQPFENGEGGDVVRFDGLAEEGLFVAKPERDRRREPISPLREYFWDPEEKDIFIRRTERFRWVYATGADAGELITGEVEIDRDNYEVLAFAEYTILGKVAAAFGTWTAGQKRDRSPADAMRILLSEVNTIAGWQHVPIEEQIAVVGQFWEANSPDFLGEELTAEAFQFAGPIQAELTAGLVAAKPPATVEPAAVEPAPEVPEPVFKPAPPGSAYSSEAIAAMDDPGAYVAPPLPGSGISEVDRAINTVPTPIVADAVFKSADDLKIELGGRVGRNELTAAEAESIFGYVIDSLQELATGPVTPEQLAEYDEIMAGFAGLTVAEAQARANSIITTRRAVRQDTEQRARDAFTKASNIETAKENRVEQERINRIGIRSGIASLQQRQQEAITGVQRAMATAQQAIASDYLAQAPGFGPTTPGAKIGGAPIYEQLAERVGLVSPGYLPFGAPVPEVPQASDIQAFQEALASARQKVQYQTEEELLAELPEYTPVPGVSG